MKRSADKKIERPSIGVRGMRVEDRPLVQAIAEGLPEWFDEHARKVAIPIDLQHQRGIVALLDGRVAGFATLYVAEGRLNIGWLGVGREHHRKGVGRALIERAVGIAVSLGIEELATWTLGDGVGYAPYEPTRRFYFANGFTVYQRDRTDNPGCPEVIRIARRVRGRAEQGGKQKTEGRKGDAGAAAPDGGVTARGRRVHRGRGGLFRPFRALPYSVERNPGLRGYAPPWAVHWPPFQGSRRTCGTVCRTTWGLKDDR